MPLPEKSLQESASEPKLWGRTQKNNTKKEACSLGKRAQIHDNEYNKV